MINRKKILVKDGKVLAVIRPSDPLRALTQAKALIGTSYDEAKKPFDEILSDPEQTYTFVGLATKNHGRIVDPSTGDVVGKVQAGDSLVPYEQLLARHEAEAKKDEPT